VNGREFRCDGIGGGPEEVAGRGGCYTEGFGFELDVFGRRVDFRVSAARGRGRRFQP
jgi:hypothetical protein